MNNSTETALSNGCIAIALEKCFSNLLMETPEKINFVKHFRQSLANDPWTQTITPKDDQFFDMLKNAAEDYCCEEEESSDALNVDAEWEECSSDDEEDIALPPPYYICNGKVYDIYPHGLNGLVQTMTPIPGGVKRKQVTRKRRLRKKPVYAGGSRRGIETSAPSASQEGQVNVYNPRPRDAIQPIKFNIQITSDASGIVNLRFNVRNPLRAVNGSGSYVNPLDWGSMFDKYKVREFVFQYFPTSPVQPGVIATAFDWDAPDATTPNYANTINYANYKAFTACKPFTVKSRIPNLTEGTRDVDEARPVVIHQDGFLDFALPPVQGQFYFNALQCTPSTTIGAVICTMVLDVRARR